MGQEQIYCQSCGMPMPNADLLGTESDGSKSADYCVYCYQNGDFQQPGLTMEEMIEICVPHMKENGMTEEEARGMLNKYLPELKRWKK